MRRLHRSKSTAPVAQNPTVSPCSPLLEKIVSTVLLIGLFVGIGLDGTGEAHVQNELYLVLNGTLSKVSGEPEGSASRFARAEWEWASNILWCASPTKSRLHTIYSDRSLPFHLYSAEIFFIGDIPLPRYNFPVRRFVTHKKVTIPVVSAYI